MPTFIAYSDRDLAAGVEFDAADDSAAIVHAHSLTPDRPVRVYRGELGNPDPTPVVIADAAPTPRTTRKVCRRPGCGAVVDHRYYVHADASGTRALWCGACVRGHALTVAGERWAREVLVTDCEGFRRPPTHVVGWPVCPSCAAPGRPHAMGVFLATDGTLTRRCLSCIADAPCSDDGPVQLPTDPTDPEGTLRWADPEHVDVIRAVVSRYGDTRWQFRDPARHRACPGCDHVEDNRSVCLPWAMLDVSGVGPGSIRVCGECHRAASADRGDDVAGYHHTTAVHPVRLDARAGVVRDDRIGPSDPAARGDPGWAGRAIVTPSTFSARRATRRGVPYMGVEVELAADETTPGVIARHARLSLGLLHAENKADSSIQGALGGVEIVTHPATIGAHRATWSTWKAPRGAEANSSCGMHVHVSRDALTPGQIDRLIYLLSRRGDQTTWTTVFRRPPNNYCRAYTPSSFARRRWRDSETSDRYRVLNVTPRHTIEFRWPASTVRGDVILATVEIIHALCLYTSPGQPGGSHTSSALCWAAFAAWITSDPLARSETRTARAYLAARGVLPKPKPRPGVTPRPDDGTDATIDPADVVCPVGSVGGSGWDRLRSATTA